MTTINPYLTFNGNCEEAFNFYKSVFRGEFPYIGKFKDMPPNPDYPVADSDKEKIMHVSLPISKETTLMGSDSSESFGHAKVMGNNFSISVNSDSVEEIERIYNALSAGGIIKMPLNKTFWGAYFGMLTDKFGIHWMVNCELQEHKDFEKNHGKNQ
jgi:PhnB protein